ncbi:C-terminal binding protein [Buttiauxella selenatireducens]|uniref:C-terminal binding protein n=1 Tax=Buttiauxella selenatireducens TaxID=3073902 RepID=A0ABY9S570_9ENTR|nr:C-terminal binding protein [Buttiauxella sp. R73]WMY72598.1 C-terminal binding protein [Buttiauxella sp. R73]
MNACILQPAYSNFQAEEQVLAAAGFSLTTAHITAGNPLPEALINAEVILIRDTLLGAEVINHLTKCKAVVRYGVGYNTVDVDTLTQRNIMLCNVPDYDTDEVSTHAMAMYLTLLRRLKSRDRDVRQGIWAVDDREPMYSPQHSVLGLIGFGRIARRLLEKMQGFRPAEVLVYDPYVDLHTLSCFGVRSATVAEICSRASMISLHVPYTPDTHHLIGAQELQNMRADCILLNTSRGGLIDEKALNQALLEKRIFGAGLDVFEQEPINPNSPLLARENLIVSDHCGWYAESSMNDLRTKAAQEAVRVLRGQPPHSCVNLPKLKVINEN